MKTPTRVPAGVPTGGRFAADGKPRATVALNDVEQSRQIADIAADFGWSPAGWGSHCYVRDGKEISYETVDGHARIFDESLDPGWQDEADSYLVSVPFDVADPADKARAVREAFSQVLPDPAKAGALEVRKKMEAASAPGADLLAEGAEWSWTALEAAAGTERAAQMYADTDGSLGAALAEHNKPGPVGTQHLAAAVRSLFRDPTRCRAYADYDCLPEPAKQAIRHWSHEQSGDEQEAWQRGQGFHYEMETTPVEVVKQRIMATGTLAESFGDWDAYSAWYTGSEAIPDHGDSRWPVIEAEPSLDPDIEYLDDGWHRLHSYLRAGDTHVDVLRVLR